MGVFDRFKNKENKKYMKYEDGKIIPVEVEGKSPKDKTIPQKEESKPELKNTIKDKIEVSNPVTKYGVIKSLKVIGAIGVIIFFVFTVKDFYVAFSDDEDVTPIVDEEAKNKTYSEIVLGNNSETVKSKEASLNSTLNLIESQKDLSDLNLVIDSANLIEKQMLSEMNQEVSLTLSYLDNKVNKNVLETNLSKSIQNKENLLGLLSQRKGLFEDANASNYYDMLNQRVQNSLDLVKFIAEFYADFNDEKLIDKMNGYIAIENSLKNNQNTIFITLLKENKIDFRIDETTNTISYELD